MHSRSFPRRLLLRCGGVTPLTILCLALLVGVAALVIDGGTLMEARRHAQAAADAAALAGAEDLYANYLSNQGNDNSGTAAASAQATASANGFGDTQSTVTVRTSQSTPPTYLGGPNAGKTVPPGYIEVTIQYNAPHLFSGVFGSGSSPIQARAVARGRCTPLNNNGVMALNLNSAGALNVSSTGGLTVNGSIQICSSSSSALSVSTSGNVAATQFILNPAMGSSGGGSGLLGVVLSVLGSVLSLLFGPGGSAANIVTSPPAPDPLRFLPAPDPIQLTTQSNTQLNITGGNWELHPGVYKDGIQISGTLLSPTKVKLHANSDGTPGIYYLDGQNGLKVSGFVTLTTANGESAGVMIYNNWADPNDSISINLGLFGGITLVPHASGLYSGLCIFQRRGTPLPGGAAPPVTLSTLLGTMNVTGTIYAAYASVSLAADLSNNNMCGQVIADTVNVGGLANINIDPGAQPTANQRLLGLVE
jgi:Flp pilus assembly protein TadG